MTGETTSGSEAADRWSCPVHPQIADHPNFQRPCAWGSSCQAAPDHGAERPTLAAEELATEWEATASRMMGTTNAARRAESQLLFQCAADLRAALADRGATCNSRRGPALSDGSEPHCVLPAGHEGHRDGEGWSWASDRGAGGEVGLQRRLFEECETAGWDPDKQNTFAEECAHLHEEVSEAFRAWRLRKDCSVWTDADGKPQGVPIEFADVLIGLFYNAELHGFDLLAAVEIKHSYNLRRSYSAEGRQLHPDAAPAAATERVEVRAVAPPDIERGAWEHLDASAGASAQMLQWYAPRTVEALLAAARDAAEPPE